MRRCLGRQRRIDFKPLEEELQHQLHGPRGADGARDRAEGVRRVDVARRRTEARRVGQVERFAPELEVALAADAEPLRQDGVEVLVARRPRDADAAVAPRAERRAGEGVDVQPVVDVLIGRHRVADAVRPLVAARALQRASRGRR